MIRALAAGTAVAVSVASVGPAFAQASAAAPTPGSVALAAGRNDAAVVSRLREALGQPDPSVRAVAARAAAVGPHPELLNDLIAALSREQDEHVAGELVRDVLLLGGPAAVETVEPQARRHGGGAAIALAQWLARVQPQRFIDRLPDLTAMAGHASGALATIIGMASRQHPDKRDALFRAWMRAAPGRTWRDLLEDALGTPDLLHVEAVLKDALASDRQEIREQTVWFVVDAYASNRGVPDSVGAAAMPRDGQAADWEGFGRELIARHRSKITTPDRARLIGSEGSSHEIDAPQARELPELTRDEQAAIGALFAGAETPSSIGWSGPSRARTVPVIAPGVIASTLQAAGCAPTTNVFATASVTYAEDGRPKQVQVDRDGLLPPCVEAATALGRLSLAADDYSVTAAPQLIVVPITAAFAACTNEPVLWQSQTTAERISAVLKPPRKTHDVRPEYPQAALDQNIQGVVVLHLLVAPSGCPFSASIVRSIPLLDLPALRAVSQWTFEPLRFEGDAKPILMTVSLNFTFR